MAVGAREPGTCIEDGRATLTAYLRSRLAGQGHTAEEIERRLPDVLTLGVRDVQDATPPAPHSVDTMAPIQLTTFSALIGPVRTKNSVHMPCRQCLRLRWQRLRTAPERTALERGGLMSAVGPSPYLTPFALYAVWRLWAALEDGFGERDDLGAGIARVYELSLETLRVSCFALVADSACPTCRPRRRDSPEMARLELSSRGKPAVDSYHPRALRDHRLPVAALTNRVCGVIGPQTVLDATSPTTSPSVGMFHGGSGAHRLHEVIWTGQTDSFESSRIAGLLEGLERYAGVEQRRLTDLVVDSYDSVRAHAVDPRACGLYSDDLYETSAGLSAFSPRRSIPWVWGYSLLDERPILVPQRIAYYGQVTTGDNFVYECSNGCASGESVEEAILHGLLELIERDSFLLAWYGRADLPEIDVASCHVATQFMAERIRFLGYDVRLLDARIDMSVPAVIAVAVRRDGGPGRLSFGSGASLDPHTAAHGALSEVASYVPTMASRLSERAAEIEAMAQDFTKVVSLADHPALFALPRMAVHADFLLTPRPKTALADLYHDWEARRPHSLDLLVDLRYCRDLVVDAGFDVIVVEQTAPEQEMLGLRTVQVIVPGLLPIDFGWSKQRALRMTRTRTAFRRAGWRATDLTEAELHRVPHPFP